MVRKTMFNFYDVLKGSCVICSKIAIPNVVKLIQLHATTFCTFCKNTRKVQMGLDLVCQKNFIWTFLQYGYCFDGVCHRLSMCPRKKY